MTYVFDASALVKRYVDEDSSKTVGRLLSRTTPAVSRLSAVEIVSALSEVTRRHDSTRSTRSYARRRQVGLHAISCREASSRGARGTLDDGALVRATRDSNALPS